MISKEHFHVHEAPITLTNGFRKILSGITIGVQVHFREEILLSAIGKAARATNTPPKWLLPQEPVATNNTIWMMERNMGIKTGDDKSSEKMYKKCEFGAE